jgi:hypothetical protein
MEQGRVKFDQLHWGFAAHVDLLVLQKHFSEVFDLLTPCDLGPVYGPERVDLLYIAAGALDEHVAACPEGLLASRVMPLIFRDRGPATTARLV